MVYGGRLVYDNFFIDSEIMIIRPEYMRYVWMGSNRFGLVLTSRLFGLTRLSPWMSNILMLVAMWCTMLLLAFSSYVWTGRSSRYRFFIRIFPVLFITAPIFTEQYLFVLQSFEISVGILTAVIAACFSDGFSCKKLTWGAFAGVFFLVWALGSYQVLAPFYISLVLLAFLLRYINGGAGQALSYGLRQAGYFALGMVAYGMIVILCRRISGTDSTYISDLVRWRIDGTEAGINAIKTTMWNVLTGTNVFYRKYYGPAMVLCVCQCLGYGWMKKTNIRNYAWFLLGGFLFLLSPFYMNILTGAVQPLRAQLVYPLVASVFLAHLTVLPELGILGNDRKCWNFQPYVSRLLVLVCAFCAMRQGADTIQLFQTAREAYRNDVLAANRMYPEICRIADRPDMEQCVVVFTGGMDSGLQGPAVLGELAGRSFFDAEAHTAGGVSARAGCLFQILGMDLQVQPENLEQYHQAIQFMKDAPDWPAQGSIRKMGDVVVVRLSESWI